jgi:hypothetical protein
MAYYPPESLVDLSAQNLAKNMGTVNMNKSNEQAYVRGLRAAGIWKSLKRSLINWDQRCVAWAKKHKFPAGAGRVPLIAAILISLTGLVAGGIAVALIIAFIWAIVFIRQNADFSNMRVSSSSYDTDDGSNLNDEGYRNGPEGYGYYSDGFRIDN